MIAKNGKLTALVLASPFLGTLFAALLKALVCMLFTPDPKFEAFLSVVFVSLCILFFTAFSVAVAEEEWES